MLIYCKGSFYDESYSFGTWVVQFDARDESHWHGGYIGYIGYIGFTATNIGIWLAGWTSSQQLGSADALSRCHIGSGHVAQNACSSWRAANAGCQ